MYLQSQQIKLIIRKTCCLFFIIIFISDYIHGQTSFKLDIHTTLLATFDKSSHLADYANGWNQFGGGGYKTTTGYYGNAVDLRDLGLEKDFWSVDNGFLPHFTQWLFWPRGNLDFRQGTMEFWFSGITNTTADLLFFQNNQPLKPQFDSSYQPSGLGPSEEMRLAVAQGKLKSVKPSIRINSKRLTWVLVSVKGKQFQGQVDFLKTDNFKRELRANEWHHFTLQWSPEGIAIYIDGRLAGSQVLENDGLALTAQPNRALAMNGFIMDELRISDIPRYGDEFEPLWVNSHRNKDAFPGSKKINPIEFKKHIPATKPLYLTNNTATKQRTEKLDKWKLEFDEKSGYLLGIEKDTIKLTTVNAISGLTLWQGIERRVLNTPKVQDTWKSANNNISFTQLWPTNLITKNHLYIGKNGEIIWDISFINKGKENLWLEALLALPVTDVKDFFDMSWIQNQLDYPRRRDEYVHSLPMIATSNLQQGLGLGLNPRQGYSALMGEWLPLENSKRAIIRQGTRVVLTPGETQQLSFIIFNFSGEFGIKDALDTYYDLFPDLYKQDTLASKYSYMGTSQHFKHVHVPDLARQYYVGNQWGHMPYHTVGDFLGTERYWGREDLRNDMGYQHALRNQKVYKSIANMRNEFIKRSKYSFDNYYTPIRPHDEPNSTATFIVDDLMPGTDFPDDPLTAGQYYWPHKLLVNEYNTPLGKKFKEDQREMIQLTGNYTPGLINDLSQLSGFRFTDTESRRSTGRAFSADRGEYLVAAFGHIDRYKMIQKIFTNGNRHSMWSDYGGTSYMLSAYSDANAIESGEWFYSLGGLKTGLEVGRNLLGEKPMALLTSYGLDEIGRRFKPSDFTPARLRDYYRFGFRRIMLEALQAGFYADPTILHGKQWNSEVNPILTESLVNGRKAVSGAKTNNDLWVIRGGENHKSILITGNSSATPQSSSLKIFHQYFEHEKKYIWVPYFGGAITQNISKHTNLIDNITVKAHDLEAVKPIAELIDTEAKQINAHWEGNGLNIKIVITLSPASPGKIRILSPENYYKLSSVFMNGKKIAFDTDFSFPVNTGKCTIEAMLTNTVLLFDNQTWEKVDLISQGNPNFCILSNTTDYDMGTASQLNFFLQQYDEEDGIEGNLKEASIYHKESSISPNFTGWRIDTRPDNKETKTNVNIDQKLKLIHITGNTSGEVRRAMMLFMRLVDRKYPHIGRHVPLSINLERGWGRPTKESGKAWKELYNRRTKTKSFFENFIDQDFLSKPILEKELEYLYINQNKNFEEKYQLRTAPYLFEPTFNDNFIYGYKGHTISRSK